MPSLHSAWRRYKLCERLVSVPERLLVILCLSCCVSPRHLDSSGGPGLSLGGYFCPQCHAKYTELPVECKVCGMSDRTIQSVCVSVSVGFFVLFFQTHRNTITLTGLCGICCLQGLTLVLAPHLARSFHHLFPLQAFIESSVEEHQEDRWL